MQNDANGFEIMAIHPQRKNASQNAKMILRNSDVDKERRSDDQVLNETRHQTLGKCDHRDISIYFATLGMQQ